MGWEWVKVCNKYSDGRCDIQFLDGEMMFKVYPRVLRAAPTDPRPNFPSNQPPVSEPSPDTALNSQRSSTTPQAEAKPPQPAKAAASEWVRDEGAAQRPTSVMAQLASAAGDLGSQSEKRDVPATSSMSGSKPPRPGSARPSGSGYTSAVDSSRL